MKTNSYLRGYLEGYRSKEAAHSAPEVLYHAGPAKMETLDPKNPSLFVTPSSAVALAYGDGNWDNEDLIQMRLKDENILAEARPGAFKDIYGKPQYLHELSADAYNGKGPIKPTRITKIKNILRAIRDAGVKVAPYDRNSMYYQAAVTERAKRALEGDPDIERLLHSSNKQYAEDIKAVMERLRK